MVVYKKLDGNLVSDWSAVFAIFHWSLSITFVEITLVTTMIYIIPILYHKYDVPFEIDTNVVSKTSCVVIIKITFRKVLMYQAL